MTMGIDHAHHDHAHTRTMIMRTMITATGTVTTIAHGSSRPRIGLGPCARAGAAGAGRAGRLEARSDGDLRGGLAAVLGRDPGAGVHAGAGIVLGRRGGDLHHGARHRHHGRAIAVVSVIAAGWAERFASTRGGYGMLFMRGYRGRGRAPDHRLRRVAADGLHGERAVVGLTPAFRTAGRRKLLAQGYRPKSSGFSSIGVAVRRAVGGVVPGVA